MLRKIKVLLWGGAPPSKEERKLLLKIDWFILSYCCMMVCMPVVSLQILKDLTKTRSIVFHELYAFMRLLQDFDQTRTDLDRSNVNNAYVSGMKEELNMQGTDFNKINTIFTVGYLLGMIPNNLIIQKVPPRIWFPLMQIVWGVLTFGTSAVKNVQSIWVIRFFQGMAESSTFVGTHYILGSWYKPAELGKRTGIFTSSGLAGQLYVRISTASAIFKPIYVSFSGLLQAAVYRNLNGHTGRSGWRWLFIIDGVITLPIAIYGFLIFPDVPSTTKAFYLTEEEKDLATERMLRDTTTVHDLDRHKLSWTTARRILSKWRWYGLSALFAISGETESLGSNNIMGQFLKAVGGFSVEQSDNYPSGVTAFAIASTLICATWTDHTRVRWPVLVYMALSCVVSAICLLVWKSPIGLKFFAFYLAGASYSGQATTFAWANQICSDDDQERGIVLASMNMWNNVINAWWSIVFYPASDAPQFTKGLWALIGTSIGTLIITWYVRYMEHRERRIKEDKMTQQPSCPDQEQDATNGEKSDLERASLQ